MTKLAKGLAWLTLPHFQGQPKLHCLTSKPNRIQWQRSGFCLIVALFLLLYLLAASFFFVGRALKVSQVWRRLQLCHAHRWLRHDLRRINKLLAQAHDLALLDLVYNLFLWLQSLNSVCDALYGFGVYYKMGLVGSMLHFGALSMGLGNRDTSIFQKVPLDFITLIKRSLYLY